ncbi:MAG: AraC family transcriptional regulator [Lachnospiraceae bacterium]|nr:AraC family transcriptional regulator [Lachnospiraceae bacterium]
MRLARTVIASMQKTTRMDEQDTNLAPITRYLDTNNSLNGLRSALCQWVSMLLDRYKDALIHPLHRSIYETMYYIDQNYSSHLTLQNLSEKVHLSPSYFCHLFKENTGMSFMDYLTNVRLDHAKEYLADTDYSVAHISELVGYRDSRYFSRIFSKKTGISPSDFRRQKRPSR